MLRARLNEALKEAMRAKDARAVSTIRLILAALKDRDIAARSRGVTDGVDDAELLSMLQTMIKQRRDAIVLYEQGGRLELAQQEQEEIVVIEGFMPRQMTEQDVREAIDGLMVELGVSGIKDMGRLMGEMRSRYAGQLDFGLASVLVREKLVR
jgi:uncharacterized protein